MFGRIGIMSPQKESTAPVLREDLSARRSDLLERLRLLIWGVSSPICKNIFVPA